MTQEPAGQLTIGQLARCAGVTVRTVRWYCARDLLTPAGRSAGGYRLFDVDALARLEFIRTLREIGLDLPVIRRVLDRELSLPEVAAAHAEALEIQIRALRLRHVVLRAVAARDAEPAEVKLMHRLARLSADERRRMIADFLDQVFAGQAADPWFEAGMRAAVPDLPEDPAPAQVQTWVELAELIADPGFRRRVQRMAAEVSQWAAGGTSPHDAIARITQAVLPLASAAVTGGLDPAGQQAAEAIGQLTGTVARLEDCTDSRQFRAGLRQRLQVVADDKVERYWQLLAELDGSPAPGSNVPYLAWVIAALTAHPSPGPGAPEVASP